MTRILKAAEWRWDNKQLQEIIENCGCFSHFNKTQPPIATISKPECPGHTVHMDVFYPEGQETQQRPYLLLIDSLSRFTMVRKITSRSAENLLSIMVAQWVSAYGVPHTIYSGAAPITTSAVWKAWSNLYGVTLIPAAARNQ